MRNPFDSVSGAFSDLAPCKHGWTIGGKCWGLWKIFAPDSGDFEKISPRGVSKTDPARKPNAIQHLSWPKINWHLYEARDLYVHARYIVFLKGTLKET